MKKILPRMLCVFIALQMITACSKGAPSLPPDIAFTPKTPEELVAQAHDLNKLGADR
jgi:hypothetical protein